MIHGMTITLWTKSISAYDGFGEPIYTWSAEAVDDVLVVPQGSEEPTTETNLDGRGVVYLLGIPKGDAHDWTDQVVEFFGEKFKTFGIPEMGIESNIPLRWHKKVKCKRYE